MTISEFCREAHKNAVAHGFWDPEPTPSMVFALIHSEWSEALEEARKDVPMVYYACASNDSVSGICESPVCAKPEGIAVELIDGIIRICDLFGRVDYTPGFETFDDLADAVNRKGTLDLPVNIMLAHKSTVDAFSMICKDTGGKENLVNACLHLEILIGRIWGLLRDCNIDPDAVLMEKFEYNKSRPYKHGKKF